MNFFERVNALTPAEALVAYLERGKSVFPVGSDKRPRFPWKPYQTGLATPYEVQRWLTNGIDALGFPTGAYNGFCVLDGDTPAAEAWLHEHAPVTAFTSRTRRGLHRFYRCGTLKIPTVKNLGPGGIDARGEGGFVVCPPSVILGHRYTWEIGSGAVPTLDCMGAEFFRPKRFGSLPRAGTGGPGRDGQLEPSDHPGSPDWIYDPVTGLIIDGRESYLCYVVLGVIASYVRDHGRLPPPKTTARCAWDQFCKACDLGDGKWQFGHCEEKVAYALTRVADGTIVIHDDEVIGDEALYEKGAR